MKKLKVIVIFVIILIVMLLGNVQVQATENFETILTSDVTEIKQGEEIEVVLSFKNYQEINKGINAYKATLEYDTNIFEEVSTTNFQTLNSWEEFLYNSNNHEFIAIKKAGSTSEESVIKLRLKAKSNIDAGETQIQLRDIVASEGKRDINVNSSQVTIQLIKQQEEQIPTTPDKPVTPGQIGNENNQENDNENMSDTKLPQTGLSPMSSFILIVIEILIIIAIISFIKIKKIDKKINKKGKILSTIILAGIISTQLLGTIYAVTQKGELNDDGKINYKDVSLLEQHLISLNTLPEDKWENADMNSDNMLTVTDLSLLVQKIENMLDYEITMSSNMDTHYFNKGEEIELKFLATISYGAKIEEVTINGQNYIAQNEEGTNIYKIKLEAQDTTGVKELKFTKVKLNVGKEEKVNFTEKIEILKERPIIQNYRAIEQTEEAKMKVVFDIIDKDNSMTGAEIELLEKLDSENVTSIKKQAAKVGNNEFILDLEENKNYVLNIYVGYNLDSDKMEEYEQDNTGEIIEAKELTLNIDYQFELSNLKTYNQDEQETKEFSKNEPIYIHFTSKNATKFEPNYVKVNGKNYEVTKNGDVYKIEIAPLTLTGEYELKIEEITLENGKIFTLDKDNIIKINVYKEKPEVQNVVIEEKNEGIKLDFTIQDTDSAIENKKVVIKNSDNKVIYEETIIENRFNKICKIPEELTSEYTVQVIVDYDITVDNSNLQKDQILYEETITAKPRVIIANSTISKEKVEKNENITINYEINKNYESKIEKLLVNNIEVNTTNKNGIYSVTIPVGDVAGKQKIELTKVIFSDGVEVLVNNEKTIEVLKSAPIVERYQVEDDYDNSKIIVDFELKDLDNSFQSGKVQLLDKTGRITQEEIIAQVGLLHFEIPVVEQEEYTFKVIVTYNRDIEGTTIIENETLLEKPIQMIIDYKLQISNIITKNVETYLETKYFERDENIRLVFTSTNITKFIPKKAQINGKVYELESLSNNQYETIIDKIENIGLKEIKIEKLWMDNTKELDIEEDNTAKIELLKMAPSIKNFGYEELDNNQVKLNFDIVDDESAMSNAKILVKDKEKTIYEKDGLIKGKNEVLFTPSLSEEYTVIVLADYDLDTNSIEEGKNEYKDREISSQKINIVQELIELKDIESVQLFTKNGEEIVSVDELDLNSFEPSKYVAKVTMKQLPIFYAEIEEGVISGNDFNLILKYDNIVQYYDTEKTNRLEVKFGEIENGIASNIDFEKLIKKIQENPTAEITLTRDLDGELITTSGATYLGNFKGTLNGNGYTIKNLTKPLFNELNNATIENLIIEGANLSGNSRGIVANQAIETNIYNVHIKDSNVDTWNSNKTGGFIGLGESNTVIENCSANNLTVSGYKFVGGFAGFYETDSIIKNSYIKGTVRAGYDAVGGMIGQTGGDVTIENSYVDIDFNMDVNWAVGGLVGYSANNKIILKNNISLARGKNGARVIGTGYNNKSSNNYEIQESELKSNSDNNRIKTISKEDITSEFIKNELGWDEEIWAINNVNYENMPKLKILDPENEANIQEEIRPENKDVYIPDIARLRKMVNYDTKKEIAYHNMNLLMPFYDAKFYIEYGNMIAETDKLNQSKIKMIIPYDKNGKMIVGLNINNYDEINKIKVVFEDESTSDYNVEFKKKLNDVATYKINDLGIGYTYNRFILNTNISVVSEIVKQAENLDYKQQIQTVTPEDETRLYVDYYNESVKEKIGEVILYIMSNQAEYNLYLDNDILKQKVKEDITQEQHLEKLIYTYNYFDKWYHMEMGGTSLTDIIFLNVNNINNDKTINSLVNTTISQAQDTRKTNNTVTFFNNVIKTELNKNNIGSFLEYFMKVLAGYENGNDWFTDNFKGMLNEKSAIGKEDVIRYRAWDLLKTRTNILLPILSAPQEDMYIIAVPSQLVVGSLNRYNDHLNGNTEAMQNLIEDYATKIGNFYGISATFIANSENILNNHSAHIQYDTRFNFKSGAVQQPGTTQDPVIKWVYEAIGAFAAQNGSAAYANGTDVYWVANHALGTGNYTFQVFSHETAHNQDGYYFYEGNWRRSGTWAEDHADSNIAQDLGDGSVVFNIRGDLAVTEPDSNNLKLERIMGQDKIYSYYKEMFETYYVLDYLTGQAFLQLTPEEQAKVAVQATYEGETDYENGGKTTVYQKISAEEFANMDLQNMEDLWDNGIALRGTGRITGDAPGSYGGDNHYSIYWYQPHNNNGRPDSYTFKRLGFEMLGVAGYSNGYVTFRSGKSKNDLDALRKITQDDTMTWKKYKMNRYEQVEKNLEKIPYFDVNEVIELYKEALKKDAIAGNRNNTNNVRRVLYGIVKRATQDFETGTIYSSGVETEISSAEQFIELLNSAEWGNYKLTKDLDFSNINIDGSDAYVTQTFVGRINGNGHKLTGISKTLFANSTFAELQDLLIESPKYKSETKAIVSNTSKNMLLNNVTVKNSNVNLPFVKTENGSLKQLGENSIIVKNNEIATLEDLLEIANSEDPLAKNMNYELVADIDLSSIQNVSAIIPNNFGGKINGNGHSLSNLKVPLVGNLTGTIINLNIENVEIKKSGTNNIATIAGQANNATLENIKINNVVIEGRDNTSAVVGYSRASNYSKISVENVSIKASHFYAGGIIGRSYNSTLKDIFISGRLEVKDTHNGGIIGAINSDILENIYSAVDVIRVTEGDSRNKNAGLYGAIESGKPSVKNAVVVGNMSDNIYKVTPATTETEINEVTQYLVNIYEAESTTGISNAEVTENIKKATDEVLKTVSFYTNTMGWSTEIWDFSGITSGDTPKIK